MSFPSNYSNEKTIRIVWQLQKSALLYQKNFVRIFGKQGGYWTAWKARSLAEWIFTDKSKSFFGTNKNVELE